MMIIASCKIQGANASEVMQNRPRTLNVRYVVHGDRKLEGSSMINWLGHLLTVLERDRSFVGLYGGQNGDPAVMSVDLPSVPDREFNTLG